LITDDEDEPGDLPEHVLSPSTAKIKLKKPKRIETDDEFDAAEGDDEHRDVKLDLQVSKKPKHKHRGKKDPRPTVLSDREDVDELDLIGSSTVSRSNEEKAPTKLRKPRASKSKKGETEFKSREFIEDSDREAYGTLSELPRGNAVQHSRHTIAEVVVREYQVPICIVSSPQYVTRTSVHSPTDNQCSACLSPSVPRCYDPF
jgi:hypothetical protein